MDLGVHLPLIELGDEGQSLARLNATVDAARECGFGAVSANDHFLFAAPWLDGPTALAAVLGRLGPMTPATTIALASLRGPVPMAKALAALDVLSEGRLVAGLGPGSSKADYDAVGIPFDDRWPRFDEAVALLRSLLRGEPVPAAGDPLEPRPRRAVPLWIGSWGSTAGLRRVARVGDGWLASAYNTTPERFASARESLGAELAARGRDAAGFPNGLATMWTWITDDRSEAERMLRDVLAPLVRREPDELREQVCVGSPEHCAELLARYADAGCELVYLWPLGDEARQVERAAGLLA